MKPKQTCSLLLISLLSLLILFPGCTKNKNTPIDPVQSVTLGVILPMDQEKGTLREKALRTAIDAINEAGGVGNSFQIVLEIRSSAGANREAVAAAAAQDIINNSKNLAGFITSFSSESKGVVEQIAIPDHYPVISGAATSGYLTGISSYFQRLCPPDAFEANILVQQAISYGITTAAIAVEEGDIYSQDLANAFQQGFGGGTQVQVLFQPDDPAYIAKLNQLLAGDPEAIFISMLNPETYVEFITRLSEINNLDGLSNTTFILCDGLYTTTLFTAPVEFMTGEVNGHPKNFGAMPSADTASGPFIYFKTKLMERYQQKVASYNAQFYDIGFIYAMAIEKAYAQGGLNDMNLFRDRVNQWIRQVSHGNPGDPPVMPSLGWKSIKYACMNNGVNYIGASGNCDIDNQGNTITPYALFKIILTGGTPNFEIISIIYP